MKLNLIVLGVLVSSSLTMAGCKIANAFDDPLVVHEWGTFTSFEDADGASVEGMQHETEALPSFVHSRLSAEASPLAVYGDASRDVPVHHCVGKMETPVIYFHTKSPRHVKVDIDYLGLLTQFFPRPSLATPAFTDETNNETHDLNNVAKSSLSFDVDLVPASSSTSKDTMKQKMPAVPSDSDWDKARQVDAAYVTSAGANGNKAETEKYIFYRGLMRTVPHPKITPSTTNNDAITIGNTSNETLHAAFVLDMGETQARFVSLGAVAPGTRSTTFANVAYQSKEVVVAQITKSMTEALIAEGLFADEARAMVRTWSEPWFSSKGTRVLYLVPRSVTDTTLPLHITPAPASVVRVLVGRVEYMTHAEQVAVAADVLDAGSTDMARYIAKSDALVRIGKLGRFAEPATRAVAASSTDPKMPAAASRVLGLVMRQR